MAATIGMLEGVQSNWEGDVDPALDMEAEAYAAMLNDRVEAYT